MKYSRSKTLSALLAVASASVIAAPSALAVNPPNLCPTQAVGVPSRPGPPKWKTFDAGDVVDTHVDDPRWNLAGGKNFASGGAKAPLQTRMLWANENGHNFLYLSFLVNITPAAGQSITAGRDIYVGFKPPTSFDPQVVDPTYPAGVEHSYIFQFHLNNTIASGNPTTDFIAPTRCDVDATCGDGPSSTGPTNFWRVFADYDDAHAVTCADTTAGSVSGEEFRPIVPDAANPHMSLDKFAWADTGVAYWKLDATPTFPTMKNQWVIQLRVPVVSATGNNNMRQGIVEGSQIWFEATADLGAVNRTSVAAWPRPPELTTHVCQKRAFNALVGLIHPDLGATGKWSNLTLINDASAAPAECGGVALDQQDIGVVFNPAAGTDFGDKNTHLDTTLSAVDSGGTSQPNEIVARIKSTTGADISGNFIARFRLANWGAAASDPDDKQFTDIPGAENGVCADGATGTAPNCGPATVKGTPTTSRTALHFSWKLTPTQMCQYQVNPKPAGVTCGGCLCTATGAACDRTTDQGVQSTSGGTTSSCVTLRLEHQCVMVEVDAPSSNVDFVNRSHWNNLEFHHTSAIAQEARIDVRGLPAAPGQTTQDVYLVVMPRNMPEKLPAPSTGVDYLRRRTDEAMRALARPYIEDAQRLPPSDRDKIASELKRPPIDAIVNHEGGDEGHRKPNEDELVVMRAAQLMPAVDFDKAQALLDVALMKDGPGQAEAATHRLVDVLGPDAAADIVPTLDIYAFYRVDPPGVKTQALYLPMTSFSMILFHEATPLEGLHWEIDGFKKVGANIYHQVIPVERIRQIRIRAQAQEAGEAPIPPGNPRWPCGCCGGPNCGTLAGLSNTGPGLIAGVFIFGRRRKKRGPRLS
jgi:hypothetical protein